MLAINRIIDDFLVNDLAKLVFRRELISLRKLLAIWISGVDHGGDRRKIGTIGQIA